MTIQRHVEINTLKKIKDFISCAEQFDGTISIISGKYMIDGKSMMGIFSLNILHPIEIEITCDDKKSLSELEVKLKQFYV